MMRIAGGEFPQPVAVEIARQVNALRRETPDGRRDAIPVVAQDLLDLLNDAQPLKGHEYELAKAVEQYLSDRRILEANPATK